MQKSVAHAAGVLSVDLDALARNYERLREQAGVAECGAVVKANAYGCGVAPVARRLEKAGCRRFFVATLDEGLELRRLLPSAEIYVLEGALEHGIAELAQARLVPALNSLEQIARWAEPGRRALLHIDTGINRLGLSAREVEALAADLSRLGGLEISYVMTHLACADEPERAQNVEQLRRFEVLRARLPRAKTSIGNTAGVFMGPAHCGDLVRPGVGLYGGNPFSRRANPLEPVVRLRARILQVQNVERGASVGYGATYRFERAARIATVGIGYADGYPRVLGNTGAAALDEVRVPVVGRISMDLTTLDVTGLPPERVAPGRMVDLIGGGIALEEVAAAAGTINYELLTGIGRRVARVYSGEVRT